MMQRLTLFFAIVGLLNPASPLLADDAPEIRGSLLTTVVVSMCIFSIR